jgi:Zn-finger nucleic acid-binding protein
MECPVCGATLQPVERLEVPLDHCPNCDGLWLDSGELSELVRREATEAIVEGQRLLEARRRQRPYDTRHTGEVY